MARDFIALVLSRALHEEIFLQMLQADAEGAADAMEMVYEPVDLRDLQAIQQSIVGLTEQEAREYLRGISEQPEHLFGSTLNPEE